MRSLNTTAKSSSCSLQLGKALITQQRHRAVKNNKLINLIFFLKKYISHNRATAKALWPYFVCCKRMVSSLQLVLRFLEARGPGRNGGRAGCGSRGAWMPGGPSLSLHLRLISMKSPSPGRRLKWSLTHSPCGPYAVGSRPHLAACAPLVLSGLMFTVLGRLPFWLLKFTAVYGTQQTVKCNKSGVASQFHQ